MSTLAHRADPTPGSRPALVARGVTVDARRTRLLHGVDLCVDRGEWLSVIGPNGAGKSTLLRALAGLVRHGGRVELHGRDLRTVGRRARARELAFVPQEPAMPAGMTVEHYVLLGRTAHLGTFAAERPADLRAAADSIERLALGPFARRTVETLSGGERRRVALARGLAQEPSVLLLDEPTSALDVGHQQDVLELVDELRGELGLTVVSTMHELTLCARFGDRLALVAGGRVVAGGTAAQVLDGEQLAAHYGARVDVIDHDGAPVVVPRRRATASPPGPAEPGGGAAPPPPARAPHLPAAARPDPTRRHRPADQEPVLDART